MKGVFTGPSRLNTQWESIKENLIKSYFKIIYLIIAPIRVEKKVLFKT